jgi:hypothetical protein
MADIDEYWKDEARALAALFSLMVGVDPYRQEKPQQFMASYAPPPGLWGDSEEDMRRHFVTMNHAEFASIYTTLRAQLAEEQVQLLRERSRP